VEVESTLPAVEARCELCNALIQPHVAAAHILAKEEMQCTSTASCQRRAEARREASIKTILRLKRHPKVQEYLEALTAQSDRHSDARRAGDRHRAHQSRLEMEARAKRNRLSKAREAELNRANNPHSLPF